MPAFIRGPSTACNPPASGGFGLPGRFSYVSRIRSGLPPKIATLLAKSCALFLFGILGFASAEVAEIPKPAPSIPADAGRARGPPDLVAVENVPRTIFETKTSYVVESDLENFGNQDALNPGRSRTPLFAHRRFLSAPRRRLSPVRIRRHWRAGAASPAKHGAVIGSNICAASMSAPAFTQPGFYTENDIGSIRSMCR